VYTIIIIGSILIATLAVICFAAYKIKAESFEFSAAIWKFVSFSIKIMSPDKARKRRRSATRTMKKDPTRPPRLLGNQLSSLLQRQLRRGTETCQSVGSASATAQTTKRPFSDLHPTNGIPFSGVHGTENSIEHKGLL
jgi:hypothetical protein